MKITLVKNRDPLPVVPYLYGKALPRNSHEVGSQYAFLGPDYYVTEEEYNKNLKQLETMTGLKIKQFHLRCSREYSYSKTDTDNSHRFMLEIFMELE